MRRGLLAPLLTMLIVLVSAAAAQANTITVNDTGDPTGSGDCLNGGQCSLRQAINAASSGDTIDLGPHVYSLTQGTNLDITQSITLAGDQVGTTSIDGSQNIVNNTQARILRVDGQADVTITNLTFTGGDDGNDERCCGGSTFNLNGGGAIFNANGTVSLQDVAFANNSGAALGGAIANNATLRLQDVSFTNDQGAFGGALFSRGSVSGTGVTFESDATGATDEAAVYLYAGTADFTNITVVGSGGASSRGGGIHNAGAVLTLTNATLADNIRGSLETDQGAANTSVANTIIADGFSDGDGDCVAPDLPGGDLQTANAITHDLGGNLDQDNSCGFTAANGDIPGADPKLASIAGNGGPTRTEALVFGSPAFGAANESYCPGSDQRGRDRHNPCDIGAFEAYVSGQQPSATTEQAQNVEQSQADLGAQVDFAGEAGGLHFTWGTSPDALTNVTDETGEGETSGPTDASQTLYGLTPGTTYYYAAVADNATGTATGETLHFTTPAGPPQVYNASIESTTDTTAKVDFTIDPQGADTTYLVKYGPDTNYGKQTATVDVGSSSGPHGRSATLTGLVPGTTYHFDVVATNSAAPGGVDSGDNTFDTAPQVTGTVGQPVSITDTGAAYGCPSAPTVDWGDQSADDQAQITCMDGQDDATDYTVTDSHTYTMAGHYLIEINYGEGGVTDEYAQISPASGPPPAPPSTPSSTPTRPSVTGGAPTTKSRTGASVSGTVNPEGGATQAYFQYGLDLSQRGPGASTTLYDHATPPQSVGSDSASHSVSASLTGLIPGALYHVRLVATNSAGTTFGLDQTFIAAKAAAPPAPLVGHAEDAQPVTGTVFIKNALGQFVPLTGAIQVRTGTVIDALHGSLRLIAALGKGKINQGTFGGAVFRLTQARNGLTTLTLIEGAFKGAPSYALCTAHAAADPIATTARSRTLQLLRASAHGKFRTRGRYSAATVRGTKWTIADRCDGTLTHDITHSVAVTDFSRHRTIILHAGQSYLAAGRRK